MKKRIVKVLLVKNNRDIAEQCIVAESFLDRLKGLIGTRSLHAGQGLLLKSCNDIHMWFMSISIDVVFLRRLPTAEKAVVTSVRKNLRPWKLLPVRDGKATETLELPEGTILRCEIQAGDELCIS